MRRMNWAAFILIVVFSTGCLHWVPTDDVNAQGLKAREAVWRAGLSPTKYVKAFELEKQCNMCSFGLFTALGGTVWFATELVWSSLWAVEAHMVAVPLLPWWIINNYNYYGDDPEGEGILGILPNDGGGLIIGRAEARFRPSFLDATSPRCCWRNNKGKYTWKEQFPECREAKCKYGKYRN